MKFGGNDSTSAFTRVRTTGLLLGLMLLPIHWLNATPPAWWSQQGATNANPANNNAAANLGQLKHIASKAAAELNATLPGGAGSKVNNLILSWQQPPAAGAIRSDYAVLTVGQLKSVAKPIYDRLIAIGYNTAYPWTATVADDNDLAAANLGQVKQVFAFDLVSTDAAHDCNQDGIPDWWETHYGITDASADPDNDGLTNLQEWQGRIDPIDYYNGNLPVLSLVSGDNQAGEPSQHLANPLVVLVKNSSGQPMIHAPVVFSIQTGSGTFAHPSVVTDGNGHASGIYQSTETPGISQVTVTASSGAQTISVTFTVITLEAPNALIPPPAGLGWVPDFNIRKSGENAVNVELDPQSLKPAPTTTTLYVNRATGSNLNNGLTASTAFQTLAYALGSTAYKGGTGACTIYIAAGVYNGSEGIGSLLMNRDTSLIGVGGKAHLTSQPALTWVNAGGSTPLVWRVSFSSFGGGVWDATTLDANGFYTKYASVGSIALCQAMAGTYYFTGSMLYVHTLAAVSPASTPVYVARNTGTVEAHSTSAALYCENLSFEFGLYGLAVTGGAAARPLTFVQCSFMYNGGNGLFVSGREGKCYVFDCQAQMNGLDGFNYRYPGAQNVLEVNCNGSRNGWAGGGANNGSTCHDSTIIIRANGVYTYNADRNVHDIMASRSWNLNCLSGRATADSRVPYESANWVCGKSDEDTTQMWLDACQSEGSAADFVVQGTASRVYTHRMFRTTSVIAGNGLVTDY